MSRLFTCLAIVMLLASPLGAQQPTERVELRRAAARDISVRISGTIGTLRIIGSPAESLVVTGTIPRGARFDGFDAGKGPEPLRGAKMFVDVPDDRVLASGTLEMRVPAGARVWAKAGIATIEVTGLTGGLDLNIVGGSIRVDASPRDLNIESMDGTVTVNGNPSWLRVKTAAGDIVMNGSSEDAAFTSVSGTTRVGGGRFDRARLESVTGAIEFSGTPVRGGSLTFDSHSGGITLRLDPGAGGEIEATSIAGTIENQLTRQRPGTGRDGRGQELSTVIGGGGAHIVVRTFKGVVRLETR
ncbi:MAG TPA: DUF4097 family beta strand repeat-containing protein [Gemmatimonadaceae bacterium]|nr:DUF4097 family beta strand repeat-containing protein [Gemmatimonadaceae bacterium]